MALLSGYGKTAGHIIVIDWRNSPVTPRVVSRSPLPSSQSKTYQQLRGEFGQGRWARHCNEISSGDIAAPNGGGIARQSDRLFIRKRSYEANPNDEAGETNEAMGLGEGHHR